MPEHNRLLNIQPIKCLLEQICLHFRGPNNIPGPQAMSKSRTVEHDDPVILGRQIDQTARFEILDHAAIAVKKNQRPAIAAFHVMQINPVDVDEPSPRRVLALRFLGEMPVRDRCRRHKGSCSSKGGHYGMSAEGDQTIGETRKNAFAEKPCAIPQVVCTMPQENEKCCSYFRTGAVEFSFQLSRNKLYVSEG